MRYITYLISEVLGQMAVKKADRPLVDEIIQALDTNPKAVERAIYILGSNQLPCELETRGCSVENGRGFSRAHANAGAWLFSIVQGGGHLRGKALDIGRSISKHYARTQLLEAAKRKKEAKNDSPT